jgi:hypothetical protein
MEDAANWVFMGLQAERLVRKKSNANRCVIFQKICGVYSQGIENWRRTRHNLPPTMQGCLPMRSGFEERKRVKNDHEKSLTLETKTSQVGVSESPNP